jgi:FdhD protein
MSETYTNIDRFQILGDKAELSSDKIVIEEPLQIRLKHKHNSDIFSITMRTPGADHELTTGLLFCEGIIKTATDILSYQRETVNQLTSENQLTVTLNEALDFDLTRSKRRHPSYSGCGICGKTSISSIELKPFRTMKLSAASFNNQMVCDLKAFLAQQPLFSSTGGSHVAGLVYEIEGRLTSPIFFEDVGRHNALDKLIGYELINNDLNQAGILLLSGRIGFELVQKSVIAGFSTIIALGAPSSLAVNAAKQFGITLLGFAKDDRFNLYTADSHRLL